MNSWDRFPPIMPESDATGDHLRYARSGKNVHRRCGSAGSRFPGPPLGGVEGVGILHGEFPDADQSGPGPCFIPEFGLDLVKRKGYRL